MRSPSASLSVSHLTPCSRHDPKTNRPAAVPGPVRAHVRARLRQRHRSHARHGHYNRAGAGTADPEADRADDETRWQIPDEIGCDGEMHAGRTIGCCRMLSPALSSLTSIYFRLRFVMCMYAPLSLSRTRSKTRTTCTCTCTCTCICDAVSVTSTMQHATMYQHARGQRSHRPVVRASRRPQSRPDREVQRRVVGSPHPRRHLAQPRNQLRKGRTVDLCKRYGVCSAEVHTGLTLRLALN